MSEATTDSYRFEVALSFAGDNKRDRVRAVAQILRHELGPGRVFFDEWFEAELAGHDAHIVLQRIYRKQTRIVVTCVCKRYNEKPWTQEEWRAIQALERECRDEGEENVRRMRFLPLRFGDGDVDGLFETAIVPDVREREPRAIADLILERLRLARGEPPVDLGGSGQQAAPRPAGAAPTNDAARPPWARATGRDQYGAWAVFEVAGVRQRMRWIPQGQFVMGSPETELGRHDLEGPWHVVTLTRGYWLGETPVTQALWRGAMGNNPSGFVGDDRPVEGVSWDDCQIFIECVSGSFTGLALRLPTEAEWERACRGGTATATWVGELSGRTKAPELDTIAWYRGNSSKTQPIGRKARNPYGLYDMLGNVFEWCEDAAGFWPYEYTAERVVDPMARQGPNRVLRGGSWHSDASGVRAASRAIQTPRFRFSTMGFRLAAG